MNFRTDLATEIRESINGDIDGVIEKTENFDDYTIKHIKIINSSASEKIGKPIGNYVTVELPSLSQFSDCDDTIIYIIKNELQKMLPKEGTVLVIGLGNASITADALGPKSVDGVLATRHVSDQLRKSSYLSHLRDTAAIIPGVVGQTGIETAEMVSAAVKCVSAKAVITVDALAARSMERLGTTVQICDSGILPGSGVGNHRSEISFNTLGVPVISMGVPTVVDARTLVYDVTKNEDLPKNLSQAIVTPSQIDLLIDRASRIISQSINSAVHYKVDADILLSLV